MAVLDRRKWDIYRTSWADVYWRLTASAKGTEIEIPKDLIAHPMHNGAYKSVGLPKGQAGDWRFPPDPEGRGLHVHDIGWGWRAHLDAVHPETSIVGHLVKDVLA